MKQILLAAVIIFIATLLLSCEKDRDTSYVPDHPQMVYRDLSQRVVNIATPAGIDIGGDARSDVWFEIWHTKDDAHNKDIHRFSVSSGESSRLMVDSTRRKSSIIPGGAIISSAGGNGFAWNAPANPELATRTLVRTAPAPTWEGDWKDANHKYLAVQVTQNGLVYNGWIELSFDTATERVILYRSGISKEAGKDIVAGK